MIIDLYFLIPVVIAKISRPIAELLIPIGIPTKETKAETETHTVTVETKLSKCFKNPQFVYAFYSLIQFGLFLQWNNYLFYLYFQFKCLTYGSWVMIIYFLALFYNIIKSRILNTLIDSFPVNIFLYLLPQLMQIIERSNVFSKIYFSVFEFSTFIADNGIDFYHFNLF